MRNLQTVIQTQKPTRATSRDIYRRFKPHDITPTDRFDKIFNFSSTTERMLKRSRSQAAKTFRPKISGNPSEDVKQLFYNSSKMIEDSALSNARKTNFLRGSGQILHYFEPSDGRASQY